MGTFTASAAEDYVIDMRSDTLSKPTPAMKLAMGSATDGDDVYREDETVLQLESKMAALFGKEAGLFVVSGTMSNLLAISCHCPSHGLEVIMGDRSHTFMLEQGGISQFSGLHSRAIPNLPDGTFDLGVLETLIRPLDDPHQPRTGLIVVENTQNLCGGKVLSLEFMASLGALAARYSLPVHLDGARALNAAVALGVSLADVARHADSVSFCFSKGVSAPIGSVLLGSKDLVGRALRMRKALGGGWRQAGGLAAAALVGMDDAPARLATDHARAKTFAARVAAVGEGIVRIDVAGVQSNIVLVEVVKPGLIAGELCARVRRVEEREAAERGGRRDVIKVNPLNPRVLRVVFFSTQTDEDIERATDKMCYVLNKYRHA